MVNDALNLHILEDINEEMLRMRSRNNMLSGKLIVWYKKAET